MGAEVGDRAAGILLEPAPVFELLHVFVAVLLEDVFRDFLALRPCEEVFRRAVPLSVKGGETAAHLVFMDHLVCVLIDRIGTALMADLEQFAGLVGDFDHFCGKLELMGHFLFAIDMFAGLQAGDGVFRVVAVRCGDDDGVQILFRIKHFLVVNVGVDVFLRVGLDAFGRVIAVVFPDVADGFEIDAGDFADAFRENAPLRTGADQRDVDIGVGGSCRGIGVLCEKTGGLVENHHACAGGAHAAEKISSVNFHCPESCVLCVKQIKKAIKNHFF